MRSTVVVASTRESSRAAHTGWTYWSSTKMKLPISILVLAALGQAVSLQPVTKRSETKSLETKSPPAKSPPTKSPLSKSTVTKQNDSNTTSKRELYEGNYGERNQELSHKYEVTGSPPKIVFTKELQNVPELSPGHQMFGMRLPQIVKISDVLSQQGLGSFEAAVAKHLYSPISVYQTRHASPTSFEVPVPAASQSAYSDPKLYINKLRKASEKEHLQEGTPKAVEQTSRPIPLYTVNQPRIRFEAFPQALDHRLPQEIFRPQIVPRKHMSSLFPIYDQLGPFRYEGQVVPSQYLHQNGLYQIVPVRQGLDYGNQEGNRDKHNHNQENQEQSKNGQPQPQIEPVPKQGYHAHPNGAISFASFSQNLPVNIQFKKAQQQSDTLHQSQQAQLQSQPIPVQLPPQTEPEVVHSQEQKAQLKQNLQLAPMFQRLIDDLQKYQPVFQQQPQFIPFQQQIQDQPRPLNALQQHLLYQDPRQPILLSNPQVNNFQRLPKFKPLPQSLLTSASFLQQTSQSPIITGRSPRPFSFEYQSTPTPENFLVQPASTQRTPLPPLKPNYSKYVQPLEPQSHTTPVFLPTPLQPLLSSTPKAQPLSDQLISSTTIQPNVKNQEHSEKQQIQEETKPQLQTSQPLKPDIIHQSEPTVRPPSIQSTTYLPFVTHAPQSNYIQYQSTIRPQSPATQSPRHDVVIQRQEIQELFFDPSPQPPQPPSSARYQNQRTEVSPQYEREILHLRTQPHHQLFEQLQPLPYQHADINSQQYLLEARSHSPQKPGLTQYREPQQYVIQQHSHPVELLQFQSTLLQSLQPELQQSPQQQQVSNQEQELHGFEQIQQQHGSEQKQHGSERTQQHESEHTQQHELEHTQQQQQEVEQAQPQQQEVEQAQQQHDGSEQAQQQHDGSEQAQQQQYQEQHLDSNNQIQISTLRPSVDTEKQTETVEIQLQTESQTTTGKPNEQPEPSSEPAPSLEEPHLGPLLNPSGLPQLYDHQQQLVAQPEYSPLLGVPPYSDVQYFGKFAESLFGNRHH